MSLLINHFYRFGEFVLDADQKVLLRQAKPLLLAPKVLDTLLTLVQHSGRIVEREELMTRLWPDTFVEDVAADLASRGCDGVVMACTEIPLILRPEDVDVPLLDSTRLLAKAALEEAISGTE